MITARLVGHNLILEPTTPDDDALLEELYKRLKGDGTCLKTTSIQKDDRRVHNVEMTIIDVPAI